MQMNPVERVQGYAETSTENYDDMIFLKVQVKNMFHNRKIQLVIH